MLVRLIVVAVHYTKATKLNAEAVVKYFHTESSKIPPQQIFDSISLINIINLFENE